MGGKPPWMEASADIIQTLHRPVSQMWEEPYCDTRPNSSVAVMVFRPKMT